VLRGVSLTAYRGEILALLGPNGSGKTTLFRLLCTLLPPQEGAIQIAGIDCREGPLGVRRKIGIVFQSPSLDPKLTVDENIACQAALYGLRGQAMRCRRDELLERFRLTERRDAFCESLSGGLKRRVELAKGMLHRPELLLLDEPSTGLDPAARRELYELLRETADDGTAVVMTTHILDEADKADRVAILSEGQKIADAPPQTLRSEMGEGLITIEATDVEQAEQIVRDQLGLEPQRVQHQLRIHCPSPARMVPLLDEKLSGNARSIAVGRPSLEDVFIAKTGHHFV
jgi:ABC-2 type transport system ATP-binding protein